MSFVSPEQLERAAASLDRIRADVAEWNANPDEYIRENFTRLKSYDFPVYAAGNITIQNKIGTAIPFVFNRVQRMMWRWFLEDMAAGRPVRWFIIKARQMGVSTWIIALFYWLTSLRANRNALIVAQDDDATLNFNSRLRSMHAEGHALLKSQLVADRRNLIHFGNKTSERKKGTSAGIDSRLVFMTAGKGELGRSYTFHAVLLSEFAIWPELGIDVEEQLAALNQSIAELPGTVIILESTAKGENAAKDVWDDETNGYRKIFISWVAYEEYRLPCDDLGELCEAEEISGKETRYGNERQEADYIRQQLKIWYPESADNPEWMNAETRARLNWRREYIDKKCLGNKTTFRREYPTVPQHAFAATAKNVFDIASLDQMRAAVEEEAMQVHRFNYLHNPEETDPGRKFQQSSYGPLLVYKTPDPYQTYVIGGDAAQGIPNGDPSSLVVLAVPDLEEVASFNGIITADKFAELAHYLGLLYNTALLAIENNERGGYAANLLLNKTLHYPRLYYRFDPYDKKAAGQPGFVTNERNKSVLVTDLAQLIYDHEILFRTPELIDQLSHYVLLKNGSMGGASGWHDDLVSAAMIAVHLSKKIHLYPARQDIAPKGSFNWYAKQLARKRAPGLLGYK